MAREAAHAEVRIMGVVFRRAAGCHRFSLVFGGGRGLWKRHNVEATRRTPRSCKARDGCYWRRAGHKLLASRRRF
jgi:hypothetical protein